MQNDEAVTVKQCLLNGYQNIIDGILVELGREQLVNAITAIQNGMTLTDVIQANLDAPIILTLDETQKEDNS